MLQKINFSFSVQYFIIHQQTSGRFSRQKMIKTRKNYVKTQVKSELFTNFASYRLVTLQNAPLKLVSKPSSSIEGLGINFKQFIASPDIHSYQQDSQERKINGQSEKLSTTNLIIKGFKSNIESSDKEIQKSQINSQRTVAKKILVNYDYKTRKNNLSAVDDGNTLRQQSKQYYLYWKQKAFAYQSQNFILRNQNRALKKQNQNLNKKIRQLELTTIKAQLCQFIAPSLIPMIDIQNKQTEKQLYAHIKLLEMKLKQKNTLIQALENKYERSPGNCKDLSLTNSTSLGAKVRQGNKAIKHLQQQNNRLKFICQQLGQQLKLKGGKSLAIEYYSIKQNQQSLFI